MERNVIDKETIFKGLRFAIIVSLLISGLLILFTIDRKSLQRIFINIQPQFLLYVLLIMLANWFIGGLRLKILIKTIGNNISLKDSIMVYLAGAFVSNVTPFASGGGPFQIYFLHKKGINVGQSSTAIVIQFVLRLFFFGLMTPIFLIFFNWAISPGVIPVFLFYLAFGFGMVFSFGIIILILVPQIMDKLINLVFNIKKVKKFFRNNGRAKRWLVKARTELREFRYSLEVLSQYWGRLFLVGLTTVVFWSLMFMVIPVLLKGFGVKPHFFRAYIMQTIFYLILPYMPSPGASGVAEIGFASLFVSFIPEDLIGLATFGWRLATFYLVLLVGGVIALHEISKNGSCDDG